MEREIISTHQKALQVNLDPAKYGTFAEIGAGQEVARWFFRVGGAAGTIAKTISAYDMTISDAIYGQAERYVSRQRLETMLRPRIRPPGRAPGPKTRRNNALLCLRRHRRGAQLFPARRRPRLAGHPVSKGAGGGTFADRRPRPACGTRRTWPNRRPWAFSEST